jgi:hypothetical protein
LSAKSNGSPSSQESKQYPAGAASVPKLKHAAPGLSASHWALVWSVVSHDMVHMPIEGPPSPNTVLFALAQTNPSPHCASEVHSAPSEVLLLVLPPPLPPVPARPTEPAWPTEPAMPPPEMMLPLPLEPPVASSLPQLAVAATVPTETMKSVNQVRALTTEAS